MSSNNELIILKERDFEVHMNSCVDNKFISSRETLLKKFKILQEAIKYANKYCNEEMVEYGYRIYDSALKNKNGKQK